MAEWSMAHAWKVCIRQRIEGSNPSFSAKQASAKMQRSTKTRKLHGLAGFLLSNEVRPDTLTYRHVPIRYRHKERQTHAR